MHTRSAPMKGENQLLIIDELAEFENYKVEVQNFNKIWKMK